MKFCKKCQTETERYAGGGCKPCIKKRSLERYYSKVFLHPRLTPEQKHANRKACQLAYRTANLEKLRASSRKWKADNKQRLQVYEKTPARKEKSVNWYLKNQEKAKQYKSAWRAANPEAKRIQANNRRAKKLSLGGKLSKGLAKKLFVLQNGKCTCCKKPLGENYHLDHIMPLALGGLNIDENMQLLRPTCNSQKHAKHPIDFMQSRGFLL